MKRSAYAGIIMLSMSIAQVAEAVPITYVFDGTVISDTPFSGPSIVGQVIPISITVVDPGTGGPKYGLYGPGDFQIIPTASFNGISAVGPFQSISIQIGSSININATSQLSGFGFDLLLSGAQPGALATGALPLSLKPGDFSAGVFRVTSPGGSYGYSGIINGIGVAVPEPASWLVFGAGLAAVGWQVSRRRPRA